MRSAHAHMFLTTDRSTLRLGLLFSSLIVAFTCSCSDTFAAGAEQEVLLGPVKQVITRSSGAIWSRAYDHAGRVMETVFSQTKTDVAPSRYSFEYDAQGNLTLETASEPDGSILYRNLYRYGYDDRGHETAVVAALSDGTLSHAEFSLYDSRGHLESKIYFTGQVFTDKSLFDAHGNVIYGARYRHGSLWLETGHLFGPDGRLRERRTYNADGMLSSKEMLTYDDRGRLIEEVTEFFNSPDLQKSVTTYEYDTMGNWTRKLVQRWMKQGSEMRALDAEVEEERSISYY